MKMKLGIENSLHERRFSNYRSIAQQDFLLLNLGFNEAMFFLYTLSKVVTTDWDARHDKIYGTFNREDLLEQAVLCGWSRFKAEKYFRLLVASGLVVNYDKKRNLVVNIGFLVEEFEVTTTSENKTFPKDKFYYLKTLLKIIENKDSEITKLYLQKRLDKIAYLKDKKDNKALVKESDTSIYKPSISSNKDNISNSKSSNLPNGSEDVDPNDIPF